MRKTIKMALLGLMAAFAAISSGQGQKPPIMDRLKAAIDVLRGKKLADDEVLKYTCNATFTVLDKDGKVKEVREEHNLVVTAGKNKVLEVASPFYPKDFKYLAIGTGTTAATIADTALQTELSRSGIIVPTNPTAAQLQFQNTFTGLTGAVTECGLLSANAGGTLFNRLVFSAVNIVATDSLVVQITIS